MRTEPSTDDNTIFLQAFAAVSDQTAANAIRRSVEERLSRHGAITRCDIPKQYWKIPEYFEVFIELRPCKPVPETFDNILIELGCGWEIHRFPGGGNWAVWNAGPEAAFFITEVRWANLECLRRPEPSAATRIH
ncbi:MAG: hypothetical protein ABSH20_11395 [Tepidisphaeraceae bacterium]